MRDEYLPDPLTLEPPIRWIGDRFELQELLGSGGLGDVYQAWDHQLGRPVAVKRMRNERQDSVRKVIEQTWREAMTTACIQHPNIVTVYDYGIDFNNLAYVVLELIEGETLETILDRGPLELTDLHAFAHQAFEGLTAAHAVGLIHRDLKPGNFMFSPGSNGSVMVKIFDFGLAKYVDTPQPQSIDHLNSLMGSIYYMAPEQFNRQPVDFRCDLYSLGCILYEAATGRTAFDGNNISDLIDAHLNAAPISIRSLRPEITSKLEAWIMKLISRHPEHRPRSAVEALRSLPSLSDCIRTRRPLSGILFGSQS